MNQNINIVAPITDDGYYSVEYIAEQLKYFSKPFPQKIVEAAVNYKDEITPKLLEFLDYAYHNYEILDDNYMGHLYALFLLAEFKETKAFQLALNILELHEDSIDLLLGDCLTEDYPNILASLYDGNLNAVKTVIENPGIYEFARDAVIRSLLVLVLESKLEKETVLEYFELLLYNDIFRNDKLQMGLLIASIMKLRPTDIRLHDKVKETFNMGLVDETIIDFKYFIDNVPPRGDSNILEKYYGGIKSTVECMSWWHCFQEDDEFEDTQSYVREINMPIRVTKIGRNHPCPCGSGKKYKKCCLLNQ